MAQSQKPAPVAQVEHISRKKTTIESRLADFDVRLSRIEDALSGLIDFLKSARGIWWYVHQAFAGVGYIATVVVAIGAAWKLLSGH